MHIKKLFIALLAVLCSFYIVMAAPPCGTSDYPYTENPQVDKFAICQSHPCTSYPGQNIVATTVTSGDQWCYESHDNDSSLGCCHIDKGTTGNGTSSLPPPLVDMNMCGLISGTGSFIFGNLANTDASGSCDAAACTAPGFQIRETGCYVPGYDHGDWTDPGGCFMYGGTKITTELNLVGGSGTLKVYGYEYGGGTCENEVAEVSLNGVVLGDTIDPACPGPCDDATPGPPYSCYDLETVHLIADWPVNFEQGVNTLIFDNVQGESYHLHSFEITIDNPPDNPENASSDEELCGDGIDNDGDGQTDEYCDATILDCPPLSNGGFESDGAGWSYGPYGQYLVGTSDVYFEGGSAASEGVKGAKLVFDNNAADTTPETDDGGVFIKQDFSSRVQVQNDLNFSAQVRYLYFDDRHCDAENSLCRCDADGNGSCPEWNGGALIFHFLDNRIKKDVAILLNDLSCNDDAGGCGPGSAGSVATSNYAANSLSLAGSGNITGCDPGSDSGVTNLTQMGFSPFDESESEQGWLDISLKVADVLTEGGIAQTGDEYLVGVEFRSFFRGSGLPGDGGITFAVDNVSFPGCAASCTFTGPEICNDGIDNDCDGATDDADSDCATCEDNDGDTFYNITATCNGLDCDDSNSSIHPDATELCLDGVDNDCDGDIDSADLDCQENCSNGLDDDGDGDIDGLDSDCAACVDGDGDSYFLIDAVSCLGSNDCDDTNSAVHPGQNELCGDGIDNDCNGDIDCADAACDAAASCQPTSNYSCTWDGSGICGECPATGQCMVNFFGNVSSSNPNDYYDLKQLDPLCINSGGYILNHYCVDGNWTSRTKLLAESMLSLADGGGNPEYEIYCADYATSLNYINLTSQWDVDGHFSGENCELGDMDVDCGYEVCVIKTPSEVMLGSALNYDVREEETRNMLEMLGHSKNYCDGIVPDNNRYHECTTGRVWYNPHAKIMISSNDPLTQPSHTHDVLTDEFSFYGSTQDYNILSVIERYGKSIHGTLDLYDVGDIHVAIKYEDFSTDFCSFPTVSQWCVTEGTTQKVTRTEDDSDYEEVLAWFKDLTVKVDVSEGDPTLR